MEKQLSLRYHKIHYFAPLQYHHSFIGSAIRGAFGWNLKNIVCINPSKNCERCFAADDCLYYDFFERKNPKYRLQFPLGGRVEFDLFIFEEYTTKLPYIVAALLGIGEEGIGRPRLRSDQFEIWINGKLFHSPNREERLDPTPAIFTPPTEVPEVIRVKFVTPLRVKENNRLVREGLKLETLLRGISHRYYRLKGFPIQKLGWTPTYTSYREVGDGLKFVDFGRWSNRQRTKMKLGGLIGEVEIGGLDLNSYQLLKLGEIIGAGKQVTFGLGAIRVTEVEREKDEQGGKTEKGEENGDHQPLLEENLEKGRGDFEELGGEIGRKSRGEMEGEKSGGKGENKGEPEIWRDGEGKRG
ncbi:MAG: CRISPR system precrRNA processing endoribonuclease RAMP protein Cas6 [Campylobacterales bacterium]